MGPTFPAGDAMEIQTGREVGGGRRIFETLAHFAGTMNQILWLAGS
jgi:hypothetical protein